MSLTIIKINGDINRSHEVQSQSGRTECWEEGYIAVPAHLVDAAWDCMGHCDLVIEDGVLVGITPYGPDIEALKAEKEAEVSGAAHTAIVAGVDVTLSDGSTGHFSLEETDQINLTTAYNAVLQGAVGYPYHADGQLCKIYPAADILAISEAATAHKLYHTTYCNHVLAWVRRTEDPAELETIVYGAELPEDLAANMAEVMTNAAMV